MKTAVEHDTISEAGRCVNTARPLTRSTSTRPKEGLAMKATRNAPQEIRRPRDTNRSRWTIIAEAGRTSDRRRVVLARCECGAEREVWHQNIASGASLSCGCLKAEPRPSNLEDRFWSKVRVAAAGECWMWQAYIGSGGYGRFRLTGTMRAAHRVSYEIAHGPIPEGMFIDHICRVRSCVNPRHLRTVTRKQNMENLSSTGRGISGVRGVSWDRGKWHAGLSHNNQFIKVGAFSTIEEAEAAVRAARLKIYTHNTADRNPQCPPGGGAA